MQHCVCVCVCVWQCYDGQANSSYPASGRLGHDPDLTSPLISTYPGYLQCVPLFLTLLPLPSTRTLNSSSSTKGHGPATSAEYRTSITSWRKSATALTPTTTSWMLPSHLPPTTPSNPPLSSRLPRPDPAATLSRAPLRATARRLAAACARPSLWATSSLTLRRTRCSARRRARLWTRPFLLPLLLLRRRPVGKEARWRRLLFLLVSRLSRPLAPPPPPPPPPSPKVSWFCRVW